MHKNKCINENICNIHTIITPNQLKSLFALANADKKIIKKCQETIINIIHKRDPRLLVICGPCSIHDVDSALDYAHKLQSLSLELQDQLYIVMRTYLEKPRTTIGWKGLINDPNMNDSCDIESGLKIARCLLLKLIKIGLPLATEVLNPIIPQYIGELFSWLAIGARTTESQIHREIASGMCSAIGFKNNTNGDVNSAINAICAASQSHHYINIDQSGKVCLLHTLGNPNSHIILRGGDQYPNFYPKDIENCEKKIKKIGLSITLMVDCSHGNSNKDYLRQEKVVKSIADQIKHGNQSIIGLMLESYIYSGNQKLNLLTSNHIKYGISVTDACISWEMTEYLLRYLYKEIKPFLNKRIVGASLA